MKINSNPKIRSFLIKADHIHHFYDEKEVLSNVSLTIRAKEIVTLIGPNGAGKSTLLKILLGLIPASKGKVSRQANLKIGFMPQKVQLDSSLPLTVEGFLNLANSQQPLLSRLKSLLRTEATPFQTHVIQAMTLLKIEDLAKQQIKNLSGGEFQRVLLARAIVSKPDLLVLDEPVQGVDLQGQTELYYLINQIKDELGCGILMVSHDLHVVMKSTNRVLCLNQHLCCSGHPSQLSEDPSFQKIFGNEFEELAVYEHHHNPTQCDHTHGQHSQTAEQSHGHHHD